MREKTLVLIKPDAFSMHYSGDIIKHYENEGLKIVAMKLMKMDERIPENPIFFNERKRSKSGILSLCQGGMQAREGCPPD